MFPKKIILPITTISLLACQINAQLTLTGCHLHSGTELCYLPNGDETTISSTPSQTPTITSTPTPTAPSSAAATTTSAIQTTAITDCHAHETAQYCVKGDGEEVQVLITSTGSEALPTAYTGCHRHDTTMYCISPDGSEVEVLASTEETTAEETETEATGENCHFHAGVEHCTGESTTESSCERRDRDYNVPLRIGVIFPILVSSTLAVYIPLFLKSFLKVNPSGTLFTTVKQFGTGIIIATAFVHLLTHAELMFSNSCLGELAYEATATAIAMAGAFLAFLVEYGGQRFANSRRQMIDGANGSDETTTSTVSMAVKPTSSDSKNNPAPENQTTAQHHRHVVPTDAVSVIILEAGIIFHSLLVGITLVVAGDSVFITLFIVILFHQSFEGLALGARIAALGSNVEELATTTSSGKFRRTIHLFLPMAFGIVTPTGMAIGIGVLNQFNGNDPSTIIALGTLDSLSAGILMWVGLVSMWAHDWVFGELRDAPWGKTLAALLSLVAGFILMGLLGKWA